MSSGVRIASTPCEGVEVRLDVRPLVCPQTVVAVLPCKRAVPRPSGKARLPPSRVDVVLPVVLCEQAARLPLGWKAGRKPVGAPSWVGLEPGENVLLCASGKPSTGLGEAHGNADNEGKQSLTLTVPVPRTVAALNATTFRLAAAPPQAKNGESSSPSLGRTARRRTDNPDHQRGRSAGRPACRPAAGSGPARRRLDLTAGDEPSAP